tara:strand:+ start:432 stop:770 length:339 start_codon:yes stop_codon:yes gene_type:complete
MGHDLRDDEIAIVISPMDYEDPDEWGGDINVGLVISPDNEIPQKVMTRIISIATMMSAFLDVATDNPEIYDLVEDHRNYLLGLHSEEEDKPVVSKDGNVYTLDIWTKTKGSA